MNKINRIVGLVLLGAGLLATDLETAWAELQSIDGRLSGLNHRYQTGLVLQRQLQQELSRLRSARTWYNGWINELQRTRRTEQLAMVNDSILVQQNRLNMLESRRAGAFDNLMTVYRQILNDPALSVAEKQTVLKLGNWLIGQAGPEIDLPDYSSFLANDYDSRRIRRLVLDDLELVVTRKLHLVDSLIAVRNDEVELQARLNEFQRDLNLLQNSEKDITISTIDRAREIEENDGSYGTAITGQDDEWGELSTDNAVDAARRAIETSNFSLLDLPPGDINSWIENDLARLKAKQAEYRDLLDQLDAESATEQ